MENVIFSGLQFLGGGIFTKDYMHGKKSAQANVNNDSHSTKFVCPNYSFIN